MASVYLHQQQACSAPVSTIAATGQPLCCAVCRCAMQTTAKHGIAAGDGLHSRLAAESRGSAEPEPTSLTVSSASSLALK